MHYKIFNINNLTKELTVKYFHMLSEKKQAKITSIPIAEERAKLFCAEIIARQCLSAEFNAPESAFTLLCNLNEASAVGNFEAEICLVSTGELVGCAVDRQGIGISIVPVEPFYFSQAQSICTDVEIRDVLSFSDYSFADAVKAEVCSEKGVMLRYACYKSLKEAQFRASGRAIKSTFKFAQFEFNNGITCNNSLYEVLGCGINADYNVAVSVIRRKKK